MIFFVDNTYNLLRDSLDSIKNKQFLDTFKDLFFEKLVVVNKDHLKSLQNRLNPLFHLINIDQEQKGKNKLVKDLIIRTTSSIEMSQKEVLYDTFYHASAQTFTYAILFNKSLKSSDISTKAIQYLNAQWKEWTATGVRRSDVVVWEKFSEGQKTVVRQIWALTTQNSKDQHQLDGLFNATQRNMEEKLELKETITTCLNTYCKDAINNKIYHRELQKWDQRFEQDSIQSIKITPILDEIVPFAKKLNPYTNVRSWQIFLQRRTTSQGIN